MDIENYVSDLIALAPRKEELTARNFSEKMADYFINGFTLKKKSIEMEGANSLVTLLLNYEVKDFRIFTFSFLENTKLVKHYTIFGENEADSMAIDTSNEEIIQILYTDIGDYEHYGDEHITNITPVATDPDSFLNALKVAATLSGNSLRGELSLDDLEVCKTYAEEAIKLAGGENYRRFWWQFMGCL